MPTNHIFFHDDLDGIFSAAIFLHENLSQNYRLYPVTSAMRGKKFKELFLSIKKLEGDRTVVLDYQYIDGVDFWVDHHYDPQFGDCIIKNEKMSYDPKAKCAAVLVSQMFEKFISFNSVHDLNMVERIDSADYPTIDYIFNEKDPVMCLRAFLEKCLPSTMSPMTYCRIVEVIAHSNMSIQSANSKLGVSSGCVFDLESWARTIKSAMVICEKISIVDQRRENQYPRYAEYLIRPEIKYCIRITPIGSSLVKVSIGFNPWQTESNDVNIGKALSELKSIYDIHIMNAGGHFNVGAAVIKDKFLNMFIDLVSQTLYGRGDMEKYAVDSTDAVERKASEMVKEGSAKNMTEARKTAATQTQNTPEDSDGIGTKGEVQ